MPAIANKESPSAILTSQAQSIIGRKSKSANRPEYGNSASVTNTTVSAAMLKINIAAHPKQVLQDDIHHKHTNSTHCPFSRHELPEIRHAITCLIKKMLGREH